jgi:MarR family transcriptional regulator, organic hydroperoxide resistance regulator
MHKPSTTAQAEKMADVTFRLLDQCQEKQERIAKSLGLTIAEFRLLRVFRGDADLSVGDLARRMALSNSRLTRILDGLVDKEVVTREVSRQDRRVIVVTLSGRGQRIQKTLTERYLHTHQEILDLLPEGAIESVIAAMEKLEEAMHEWTGSTASESVDAREVSLPHP